MTELHWRCLTPGCADGGTTTGTESGADAKHLRAEGHATTASLTTAHPTQSGAA